ncbi:MAG: DegV family protein [Lachnospiraceae bacterium]|nr:DegV family protein [Lachnospiraceae bacterium]
MSKIAIVTDSNSGITPAQAKELGVYVVPMPFMINGDTFFEDINLTKSDFYQKMSEDAEISTSQPSPESVLNLWDTLLQEYDEVVHIPMSSALSGSCSTAYSLSLDYDGKVVVVDNQRISVTQRQSVLDALKLAGMGKSAQEIHDILVEDKLNSTIYIMLDTLYYLKKGGRITPAAAALGTLLRLKPVLTIQGEKLDAYSKARTTKQGKETMLAAIRNDIESRLGGISESDDMFLAIVHTNNPEGAEAFKAELQAMFPQYRDIYVDELSLSVACHIGPGSIAVAAMKKLNIYQ